MARIIYQNEFDRDGLEDMDFNQALRIIKGFMGEENILDALIAFEKRYEKAEIESMDNELWEHEWRYEIYAYNLLVEGFGQLFAPKEAA
jgi:hypothetical protein